MDYFKPELLNIKAHPDLDEKFIQNLIASDPSILGLGNLELRDKERRQPGAGRLDLLLQHEETLRRYEVEIQLGATDETHIIRTIEYWDIERRRYPQYDHCAVLIAENITSRFLNVISLFNGAVPLIAIQMRAMKVDGRFTLLFTRVLDELSRGLVDEDEAQQAAPADRAYWEERTSRPSMQATDTIFEMIKGLDGDLSLKYNKFYIGLQKSGSPHNFVEFRPRRKNLTLWIKLPQSDDIDRKIEDSGLDTLEYDARWGFYKLRINPPELKTKMASLQDLVGLAQSLYGK